MTTMQCLRVILETSDTEDVLDLLQNSTLESSKIVIRGSTLLAKDIARAKTEKDPQERVAKWERCLKAAKGLRAKAKEIPPDSMSDHAWRMMVQPWWSTAAEYTKAAVVDKNVSEMNKNSTIEKFDIMIKYIEHELSVAKKKVR